MPLGLCSWSASHATVGRWAGPFMSAVEVVAAGARLGEALVNKHVGASDLCRFVSSGCHGLKIGGTVLSCCLNIRKKSCRALSS
jgi:hypothetical protein